MSYPDEIRPSKAIKFDSILKISAKNEPADVEHVKTIVREILDVNDELHNTIDQKSLNDLREKLREHGPILI